MEKDYLPNPTKSGQHGLGVIVDARIPEIQGLLEADAYREEAEELFEGIVGHFPVDRRMPKANRLAAILVGVPAAAIAGIVMGDQLASAPGALERVNKAFLGRMPILNVQGGLLNSPLATVA